MPACRNAHCYVGVWDILSTPKYTVYSICIGV